MVAYYESVGKSLSSSTGSLQKRSAGGEGLTPDYLSFRNTYWGQPHPISYPLLWRIYLESPEVHGAIDALVDSVCGDGWELKPIERQKNDFGESKEDMTLEKFDRFLKENEFATSLHDVVTQLNIFGDAYIELVRDNAERYAFDVKEVSDKNGNVLQEQVTGAVKILRDGSEERVKNFSPKWYAEYEERFLKESRRRKVLKKAAREFKEMVPQGQRAAGAGDTVSEVGNSLRSELGRIVQFFPRASETIQIDYNEHGEVIKYIQRVKHRRVDYYPDEMIHFVLNRIGNRPYGTSSLMSLAYSIQTKMSAEGYTFDYFRRGMMPRIIYVTKNLSEEQVKRMRQGLEQIKPQQDIILYGEVEPIKMADTNQDLQFKDLLKYLREQIFIALQVPPTLLGLQEGSNRNTSQTQMEMFDRKKKSLKHAIEEVINNHLFTPENFGLDVHFSFKEDNTREELKKAQTFGLLSNSQFVHPNEVRAVYDLPALTDEELKGIGSLKTSISPPPVTGFGGKKTPNNQKNGVAPEKSSDRMENAENQNVESQMENKSFAGGLSKSDHIDLEIEESKGGRPIVQQGSITRHHSTYNVGEDAIVDRERARYPYGASPMEALQPYSERRTYAIHRVRELVREMLNAFNPDNSLSLNTDRNDYSRPEEVVPPKHGSRPAESNSAPTYRAANSEPERDEVSALGRRVWAASDVETKGLNTGDDVQEDR